MLHKYAAIIFVDIFFHRHCIKAHKFHLTLHLQNKTKYNHDSGYVTWDINLQFTHKFYSEKEN